MHIDQAWVGKYGSTVRVGCPTDADSEATPTFKVVEKRGIIVPEVPDKWSSNMMSYSPRVWGYDQVVVTLLVDSSA